MKHMMRNILDEQFDISYYIKGITYTDTENMAIFERKQIYSRLIKRKEDERQAAEDASKKNNPSKITTNNRPRKNIKR